MRPFPAPRPDAGDQSYAIRRFTDEANRLYGVLNYRLHDSPYLAGSEYSIADMIAYPWTVNAKAQGQDIDEFKYFKRWFDELRPPGGQARHGGRQGPAAHPATISEAERAAIRKRM